MNAILPVFSCLALALVGSVAYAQATSPPGSSASTRGIGPAAATPDTNSGATLLRRVLATADSQRSISAKVRHKVELMDRPMFGVGSYLQQGRGPERMLRFELVLQGTVPLTTLQVCDGLTLWNYEDFADRKTLSRVDITRLRRARPKAGGAPPSADAWLALGGLPRMIADLDASFQFGAAIESLFDENLRVWTIEGRWKPDRLIAMLPDQKDTILAGGAADVAKLGPNLPDRVVLHVGYDDLFPYRFEYWRAPPGAKSGDRGALLTVMEFYEVQLGATIDRAQFRYAPPDVKPVERTGIFLERFGLEESGLPAAKQNAPARR